MNRASRLLEKLTVFSLFTVAAYGTGAWVVHFRSPLIYVPLAVLVLGAPFGFGLRTGWRWLPIFLVGYLVAALLLVITLGLYKNVLAGDGDSLGLVLLLVLAVWMPVGWSGITIAFAAGRAANWLLTGRRTARVL